MKAAVKKPATPPKSPAKSAPARGLGKGLSALMSESYSQIATAPEEKSASDKNSAPHQTLSLAKIRPGQYQPRSRFEETSLNELTDSIRKNGVMQPILVRPDGGTYEIIAGERRWRAAKMAGLTEIPVLIREMDNEQALELALVENIQRADLHPLEESAGYQRLMDDFGYTQETLAKTVHKSRSHIANLLRLLSLPHDIRQLFLEDKITMGHARALIGLTPQNASLFVLDVVHKNLSVRDLEKRIRTYREGTQSRKPREKKDSAPQNAPAMRAPMMPAARNGNKDPDILALEETLSENLGLKVSIEDRGQSGEIMIAYESLEQLDEILRRLGGSI